MASPGFCREQHLLTAGVFLLLDDCSADILQPGRVLQMIITNLRNRPLSTTHLRSLKETILSLYHNLVTGSEDFPVILFRGSFRLLQLKTPFVEQERRENTTPSPLMEQAAGLMVPAAGSRFATSTILTPVLPEKTQLETLKADRRNCVRHVEVDGRTVTRVISPVYRNENTKLTNCWRLSDYRADGQVLMSVLCRFTKESAQGAKTQSKKRKGTEETCSSPSPPKKRLRV